MPQDKRSDQPGYSYQPRSPPSRSNPSSRVLTWNANLRCKSRWIGLEGVRHCGFGWEGFRGWDEASCSRAPQVGSLCKRHFVWPSLLHQAVAKRTLGAGDPQAMFGERRRSGLLLCTEWVGLVAKGSGASGWGRGSRLGRHPSRYGQDHTRTRTACRSRRHRP